MFNNISMTRKKYFKIEHGHILYTRNNWKDYFFGEDSSAVNESFETEENATTKQTIRLRYLYGDQAAYLILEEFRKIDNIYFSIKKSHLNQNDGFGDHFEIFAASLLYDISYEAVIDDYLIIGPNDGGVDVIYYNDTNVDVIQIKMKHLEKDNAIEYMEAAFDEYEKTGTLSEDIKKDLKKFLDAHYSAHLYGKNISYLTISANSKRPENILPETIYNDFIGKTIERSKLFFKNSIEIEKNIHKQSVIHKPDDKHKEIFLFANAKKLVETLSKHIESEDNFDYLFVDNVRGRLKRNNSIIQTIKSEPKMFSFYNNGISIIGSFETQEKSSKIVVKNPIIINGQQTVVSLFAATKDGDDLSKVFVPVFLKSVSDEEELRKIARYNNTQTKISSIDLLSIDSNLRKIQSELLANYINDKKSNKECFYLDIVRNGKNKHKDKAKQLFDKQHIILVSDFVKLYSSIKDKESLGSWKNALDTNINKTYKNGFDYIPSDEAWKICKSIFDSKNFIGKSNDYKIADLLIQFLFYYGYSSEDITKIIDHINSQSDSQNIARANAYRKADVINTLRKALENLSIANNFDLKNS